MLVQYKNKVNLWNEKGNANNVKRCANGRSSFFAKQRKPELKQLQFTISDLIKKEELLPFAHLFTLFA